MSVAIGNRLRSVTPGQLIVVAAFIVLLCVIVRRGGDPDIFWHLVTGQWMVDHHQLVSQDIFTFTVHGRRWIDPEYTTEIIAYLLFKAGGLTLVSLGFAAVTFAGFLLIWRRVRIEKSNPVIAAVLIGVAGLAGAAVWGPRPQMITFAFTCLELFWLDRYLRGRSRAIYWLPLVMVAWANLHGGFLFGLVPVGVAAVVEAIHWIRRVDGDTHKRRCRNLVLIFVGCCVAAVLNPRGISLYGYVIQPQFSGVQQNFIAEWQSPNFHVLQERGLEAMLLLIPVAFAVPLVPSAPGTETPYATASLTPKFQVWGTVFDADGSGSMTLSGVELGPHDTQPNLDGSGAQYAINGEFIGAYLNMYNGNVLGNTVGTPAGPCMSTIGPGTPALLVQYNSLFAPAPGVNSYLLK